MDEAERALGGLRRRSLRPVESSTLSATTPRSSRTCASVISSPRVGDGLLEQRKPVAQAAFRGARQHGHGAGLDLEIFGLRDALDLAGNFFERERAKLKKLRARFDRVDQIFRARRGQNKDHALRAALRESSAARSKLRRSAGGLRRGSPLCSGSRPARNAPFRAARESGRCRGWMPRQFRARPAKSRRKFRGRNRRCCPARRSGLSRNSALWRGCARGRFSHSAHARKNVRMRHAIRFDGVRQRLRDVLLPDNFAECLRAIFSRDDFIAHRICSWRPAHRTRRDKRNFGYSAAHEADPLPLLPSGPGGVHGESLHRARSSTDRQSPQKNFLRAKLLREV